MLNFAPVDFKVTVLRAPDVQLCVAGRQVALAGGSGDGFSQGFADGPVFGLLGTDTVSFAGILSGEGGPYDDPGRSRRGLFMVTLISRQVRK